MGERVDEAQRGPVGGVLSAIGNTPIVRLHLLPSPGSAEVWVAWSSQVIPTSVVRSSRPLLPHR